MKHLFINIVGLILLSFIFTGCTKEDAYKDFAKDGSRIYPGKPLELKAQAGKNRAKLTWIVIDAKVSKFLIYWNNKQDSMVVPAVNTGETADSVKVIIDNLPEANYLFEVASVDGNGHKSITEEISASVYGDTYISSLLNRALKSSSTTGGITSLLWGTPEQTEVGLEVKYTDNAGAIQQVTVAKTDTLTILPRYKNGSTFSYRTFFLPDTSSFDIVATQFSTAPAPVISYPELNRSKFASYIMTGDVTTAWGWTIPMLWDGNLAEGSGFHTFDMPFPHKFSIDLGESQSLHEIKLWQRTVNLYDGGNWRNFEIWGSNSPAADGSYTGWTKLLACVSIKPSGQATGFTTADAAYATKGESYIFPEDVPPVRYIRFKILNTWAMNNPGSSHMMELRLWSK